MGTPRPRRLRLFLHAAAGIALSLAGLLAAPPAVAGDLNGHWRSDDGDFYVLERSGDSISLSNESGTPLYEGTITGSAVELTSMVPTFPSSFALTLSVDETALVGEFHSISCVFSSCINLTENVTLSRCACHDGNMDSGDGCDIECRVEPCHSCTAEPSTCTPVADSTACEDPSDCVSGGRCSAGVCDGGLQASSCVDIGGSWRSTMFHFEPGYSLVRRNQVVERGGELSFYRVPEGTRETVGTLDTSTGALLIVGDDSWPYCGVSSLDGKVAADARSYTGMRLETTSTPHGCVLTDLVGEIGLRCASSDLQPSDGCVVDSCQRCSGDPQVCVPVPDQTPCHSDDPCTVVAACESGQCVASVSDRCPLCTVCDGAGGCTSAPRNNCRKTDDPSSTMLSIKSTRNGTVGSFRWEWKGGAAVRSYDLGRPEAYSDVALCVFDESAAEPGLMLHRSVEYSGFDGLEPWISPGWSLDETGGARFRDSKGNSNGITSIELGVGDAGESRVRIKGKGAGLPTAPFSLPLRAQLQVQGGACFEGKYAPDRVLRNTYGMFRAKGTP